MHEVTITDVVTSPLFDLMPGKYVCDDDTSTQIMLRAKRGTCKVNQCASRCSRTDGDPKSVLVARIGAFGDLLMLTPSLKTIKKRWPNCSISLACLNKFKPILFGNKEVDEIIDYPIPVSQYESFDYVISLENTIEGNTDIAHIHGIDLFAQQIGLGPLEDRTLSYEITQEEKDWASSRYPRTGQNRVAIHVSASMPSRNYPEYLLTEVIISLIQKGHEVFLVGDPSQWRVRNTKSLTNLMLEGLNIRQSIAAMATADVLLAPDSVMFHVASAIGMKTVGLFGPIPWELRSTSDKAFCLQGHAGCTPCCFSGDLFTGPFPAHCPTKEKNMCALLADIKPERIVSKLQLLMK